MPKLITVFLIAILTHWSLYGKVEAGGETTLQNIGSRQKISLMDCGKPSSIPWKMDCITIACKSGQMATSRIKRWSHPVI